MTGFMERVFGVGHRIFTGLGVLGGILVAAGQYLELIPPEWRTNKWYGLAVSLVALGAWLRNPWAPLKVQSIPPPPPNETTGKLPLALLLVCLAAPAFAQEGPKFGGCLEKHPGTCFAPAVSITMVALSLKTGDLTTTVDPGVGYGVSFFSDRWYKVGISTTFAFPQLDGKRRVSPAGVVSFAEYARIGIDCPLYVGGGFSENARILLAFGTDFGSAK